MAAGWVVPLQSVGRCVQMLFMTRTLPSQTLASIGLLSIIGAFRAPNEVAGVYGAEVTSTQDGSARLFRSEITRRPGVRRSRGRAVRSTTHPLAPEANPARVRDLEACTRRSHVRCGGAGAALAIGCPSSGRPATAVRGESHRLTRRRDRPTIPHDRAALPFLTPRGSLPRSLPPRRR
jgi:hypothetical protein